MDHLTPGKRSWNMSRIKSKDTTPERIVRSFLHRNGFRFRLHVKDFPGKPDIVLPKYKTVIEVRGCYWHRHENCKDATTPSTNTEFWKNKFAATVARDKRTEQELKALGWKVIVLWECEISSCCTWERRLYHIINQQKETFYLYKTPKHYRCDF